MVDRKPMYAKCLRVRSDTKDGITKRLLYLFGVVCTPVECSSAGSNGIAEVAQKVERYHLGSA